MKTPRTACKTTSPPSDAMVLANVDDRLHEEMQRLAAINQELLGNVRPEVKVGFEDDELALLRSENAELRARVEELEQVLQAPAQGEDTWLERQKEYESLVEEKSEVIRALHLKLQQFDERGGAGSPSSSAAEDGDVQRLKKELEEQRHQLEEDEQGVMQQMRQMEMAMSKDRAELARQRNEVQRLLNDLNREIEIAARDPGLRERLVALQRLQGEVSGRAKATIPLAANKQAATPIAAPPGKKSSGLLRRIFGK